MKIFLHIGFPRTGTTFLQEKFFSNQETINFLGKPWTVKGYDFHNNYLKIEEKIFTLNDKDFEFEKENFINFFKLYLNDKKVNIFSQEDLLRVTKFELKNGVNFKKVITRYYTIFSNLGDTYLFFFIRSHTEMLLSSYIQNYEIWEKYEFSIKELINTLYKKENEKNLILNNFKYFEIHEIIKNIAPNKFKMFIYEDFKLSNHQFLINLTKFLNIKYESLNKFNDQKINTSSKSKSIPSIIFLLKNKIINYKIKKKFLENIKSIVVFIKNQIKIKIYGNKKFFFKHEEAIKNYYKEDINKFDDKIINKLKKYNYL